MFGGVACPISKECFAKRGHVNSCYLLTAPAVHLVKNGDTVEEECAFRKTYMSKPKDWVPKTDLEKAWAEKDKRSVL